MNSIKDDTIIQGGLNPALVYAIAVIVVPILNKYGIPWVETSGAEQTVKHMRASEHYGGNAKDFRKINQQTGRKWDNWDKAIAEIQAALNCDFDLVDEPTHGHLEFQPKRRL